MKAIEFNLVGIIFPVRLASERGREGTNGVVSRFDAIKRSASEVSWMSLSESGGREGPQADCCVKGGERKRGMARWD